MNSMIFMKHWLKKIESLTEEQKGEVCYRILVYGLTGEDISPKDPVAKMAYDFIKPQIEQIQKKFKIDQTRGKAGGRPKQISDEQIWDLAHNQGMKGAEIAEKLGIPKTTVYSSEGWRQRKEDLIIID